MTVSSIERLLASHGFGQDCPIIFKKKMFRNTTWTCFETMPSYVIKTHRYLSIFVLIFHPLLFHPLLVFGTCRTMRPWSMPALLPLKLHRPELLSQEFVFHNFGISVGQLTYFYINWGSSLPARSLLWGAHSYQPRRRKARPIDLGHCPCWISRKPIQSPRKSMFQLLSKVKPISIFPFTSVLFASCCRIEGQH